jgi:DNA-directed RNA polymerase
MMSPEDKIRRELALEDESINESIRKYHEALNGRPATPTKKAKGPTPLSELPPGLSLVYKAIIPYCKAIQDFKEESFAGGRLKDTRKFLNQFSNEELAFIVARRIVMSIGLSDTEPVQRVALNICKLLQDHLEYKLFNFRYPGYVKTIMKNFKTADQEFKRIVLKHSRNKMNAKEIEWYEKCPLAKQLNYVPLEDLAYSMEGQVHVGIKLIDLFIESTGYVEKVRKHSSKQSERVYYLKASPVILELLKKAHTKNEILHPLYMPMVIKPLEWKGIFGGGYLNNAALERHPFIKQRDKSILELYKGAKMPRVYKAVNNLQSVPWRINKQVFDVLNELWKCNARVAKLPGELEEPLPPFPWGEDVSKAEFKRIKEEFPEQVKAWKHERHDVWDRNARNTSKRVAIATKIELAQKFINDEEIFFCYQIDWRGRIYPIQTFLNPQSDDTGKALLEFSKGKPLGSRGAYWLQIHLANEFDKDYFFNKKKLSKLTFEDRIKWVETREELILDSARNPLDGARYWMNADHPFQFLAACFEYLGYKEQGEGFISHISVGVDGSCNGLQNFSAMQRDTFGGTATNLIPSEFPADVYDDVLELLEHKVALAAGFDNRLAKAWIGKLDRDIVKTPVMTYPYNVSAYGVRDQIKDELKDRDTKESKYIEIDNFEAAKYLTPLLLESIAEVVVAAKEVMDWLKKVAKVSSKAGLALSWTTPIGFTPFQDYKKSLMKRVQTFFGGIRIPLSIKKETDVRDSMKQVNGIAPNWVHSFDASHLMLTVNECFENGITDFSAIHDSYGTHPSDVDQLGIILRNKFIEQYSTDVLAKFRASVVKQLSPTEAKKIPKLPKKGSLDLSVIRESAYFFA